jgi:hypothetical protein
VARAVLTFLEEGKYDGLADAMDKLGITADELRGIIELRLASQMGEKQN